MAPEVNCWEDLAFVSEDFDIETGDFNSTDFAVVDDDDVVYFGQLEIPKDSISLPQLSARLSPIPDDHLFPEHPVERNGLSLTMAQEMLHETVYVKRPNLAAYAMYKKYNSLSLFPKDLMHEAQTMELLLQNPHPHIIRYHGCQVRRGRITGLVLDRLSHNLFDYLRHGHGTLDHQPFMAALESAIHHFHSLGWAHNDVNPGNVMVNAAGMPVLIDFGSARPVGQKLTTSRGTAGWIDCDMEHYTTSEKCHDVFALEKIRAWLEKPEFDD